jgi:hypothetical protein
VGGRRHLLTVILRAILVVGLVVDSEIRLVEYIEVERRRGGISLRTGIGIRRLM